MEAAVTPERLEAEGHALVAEGHARLAEAAKLRATGAEIARASGDELVPLKEAASRASTTVRVVRDAIAAGKLRAYGKQRDRSVRVSDLNEWIESRRTPGVLGPDDNDMDRRVAMLAKRRRSGRGNG